MTSEQMFYTDLLNKELGGGTIIGTAHDSEGFFGLRVKMPNSTVKVMWIYSDDEGNNPGSFEIS